MTRVVGLDLSLTAPGFATVIDGKVTAVDAVKPPAKLRDVARIDHLAEVVHTWTTYADLVVVEGPSYGSQAGQAGHHERAGLFWVIRRQLAHGGLPAVVVPPSSLKQYATGKGNAGKAAMCMAAARRFVDVEVPDDDNAVDALWLAAMGSEALALPPVALPAAQRAVVGRIEWPGLLPLESVAV